MHKPFQKIVIIGAGFAGLSAAKALAKAPVDVTVVDRQNHHLFQPLLYQVATAALTPADIAVPIRRILRHQRNVTVAMDSLVTVDTANQTIALASGTHLNYDALVIATGAQHSYFGNDQWADVAPGLKTLNDALSLRDRVLKAFEHAEQLVEKDSQAAARKLRFVIVGAGPTGVELAGAISELAQSMMRDFRKITADMVEVILVEGADRILPGFLEKLSAKSKTYLEQLGVSVRLNTRVIDVSASHVRTEDETIATETTIWAAGVRASPVAEWLGCKADPNGRIAVDETLRPAGHANIYVIGDVARYEQDGAPLPGIAPVAKQMGTYVGKRLARTAEMQDTQGPFRYADAGALATIGRNRAVADIYGMQVTGFPGWLLWGAAHVYFLIGFKNRLFVTLQWIWSYVTWQRGVRLIVDRKKSGE